MKSIFRNTCVCVIKCDLDAVTSKRSHICINKDRLHTHKHADMKEHTCSSTHTCDNRCTRTHTQESDACPSGPQTAVCHDNHGTMTWTQIDKSTMKQEKTKGKRLMEIKARESRSESWHEQSYFNLSLSSFHTAGAQTLSQVFLHFLSPFVLSLSLFYQFFLLLTCLVYAHSRMLWPR